MSKLDEKIVIKSDHLGGDGAPKVIILMFYDKGSYATLGNFPSVEWILVNIIIATNFTDNIL